MKNYIFAATLGLGAATLSGCGEKAASEAEDPVAKAARSAYEAQVMDWRAGRVQRLTRPDGWLSLVGMHWVDIGSTRLGSAADNGTRLAVGPAHLGLLTLARDGTLTLVPDPEGNVLINGEPASGPVNLVSDADSDELRPTTVVGFNKGDASFIVIKRGGRYALRVRDALAPTRTSFPGIPYFDIDPGFRFTAAFTAHPPGQKIEIVNVLGMIENMDNPGTVTFEKDGRQFTLEAVDEGDHRLFLIFADRTSGHETYAASRFLYAEYPDGNGNTVVDFNEAYNPPCAFTDYSTCPMPPLSNRMDLKISAGEKKPLKSGVALAN